MMGGQWCHGYARFLRKYPGPRPMQGRLANRPYGCGKQGQFFRAASRKKSGSREKIFPPASIWNLMITVGFVTPPALFPACHPAPNSAVLKLVDMDGYYLYIKPISHPSRRENG
jgi:hypothetical protein